MSTAVNRPMLEGFDPFDAAFVRDPFPVWSRAQHEAPVFFVPELDVWVLTRHADVERVVTDWKTFSSRALGAVPVPEHLLDRVPANLIKGSFIGNDPPRHTGYRKVANQGFTRPRVAAMEQVISQQADALIDGFASAGRCDLMRDFCYPLALHTIIRLLDLPTEHAAIYRQGTEDLFALLSPQPQVLDENEPYQGPVRPMSDAECEERWTRLADAFDLYRKMIEERRREPREDLLSLMANAVDHTGAPILTDDQLVLHIQEIIAAGNDTTANLIGSMVLYLSEQPEQLAELAANPELMPNAIEEGLRRRGSSVGMFRITTEDVEIADVKIPRHSVIWLVFQAAGHDEERFPEPRQFDIHRINADEHLSFGKGRHFCMGAPLARLEAGIAMNCMLARLPNLRAVPHQELAFLPTLTVSMLDHLEVEWAV